MTTLAELIGWQGADGCPASLTPDEQIPPAIVEAGLIRAVGPGYHARDEAEHLHGQRLADGVSGAEHDFDIPPQPHLL